MAPSAQEAATNAPQGECVIGWKLNKAQRKELLQQFPAAYGNILAHHVTLASHVAEDSPLPEEIHGEIVGCVNDGHGVQAMIVSIGGTTDRPDGSSYHITWSLGEGREARESNDVLRSHPWTMIDLPMPVRLRPAVLN
ncbi:MAG TPA: hypothetical protein VGB59_08355 [Allosphingosinicella sp.]|jgi:hypothetical protein